MISGALQNDENAPATQDRKAQFTPAQRFAERLERVPFFLWVLLICAGIGLFSVWRGPDNYWDLPYYHLYAPWAYLHHRYLYDVGPAQAQGFFNPTADFLLYAMISSPLNDYPRVIAFVMGAVHGINAALVLAIACHIIRPADALQRVVLRGAAFVMSVTGVGFISLIGVTSNDLVNSIFILAALLIQLKCATAGAPARGFALSGLIAGLGVGLKYTVATFLPGLGLVCLVAAWRARSLLAPVVFGVAVILGFLVAAGHHLLTLWQIFGDPTFPFLNNIFKSPWYQVDSLLDTQFIPRDFWQYIAYPFYWTKLNSYVVTELPFRDWRGAIAYIAIFAGVTCFVLRAWRKSETTDVSRSETHDLRYLFLFVIVSFFVWEKMFGNLRYGVVLELVAGIATIGAIVRIVDDGRARLGAALALIGVIAVTTIYIDWGHRAYGAKYIAVEVPPLPPQSDVLIATWDAVSYFIPYAEPSAHYLGIENNYLSLSQNNKLVDAVRAGMRTPGTAKFVLSVGDFDADKLNELLGNFDLKLSSAPCSPIHTNLIGKPLSLCPAEPR